MLINMPYDYDNEKDKLFTEEGQKAYDRVRDNALELGRKAGAFKMWNVISGISGDFSITSWVLMACVDRMVRQGLIREVHQKNEVFGQDRIFVLNDNL
jgi:hypothetical protein